MILQCASSHSTLSLEPEGYLVTFNYCEIFVCWVLVYIQFPLLVRTAVSILPQPPVPMRSVSREQLAGRCWTAGHMLFSLMGHCYGELYKLRSDYKRPLSPTTKSKLSILMFQGI